jgi:non-heme chloroperoxidase
MNGTLKVYPGYPHGMLATNPDTLNADTLALIQG